MGGSSFIDAWAEGGWDGWDDSALAASALPCYDTSVCTRGRRRRNERLLRQPHVEAMHAWRCTLAAGGGEVDGASESRRATRHDGGASAPYLRGYARSRAALDDGLHGTHLAVEAWPAERPA
jgi:hypothetical protein